MNEQAPFSPYFRILGYFRPNCGLPWYYVDIKGETRAYRAWETASVPFYLDLVPSQEHWRSMFPGKLGSRRFDVRAAREWFIKAAQEAGEFDPPASMRPRQPGRPRKTA